MKLCITCIITLELSTGAGWAVPLIRPISAVVVTIAAPSVGNAASRVLTFELSLRARTSGLVRPIPAVVVSVALIALRNAASVVAS